MTPTQTIMARGSSHPLNARSSLLLLAFLLAVLAIAPTSWLRWISWVENPVNFVLIPVKHPLDWVAKTLTGGPRSRETANTPDAELARQVSELQFALLNERDENDRLRRQIAEIQQGLALNPETPRLVPSPIVGGFADLSSGLIQARAGEREGVVVDSVAVVEGVNLVGRVTKVHSRYSLILPITRKASGPLDGVVMLSDNQRGPICQIKPVGDGTLDGPLGSFDGAPVPDTGVKPGMLVRLTDSTWPSHARMLVIGVVERIYTADSQKKHIVVRPRIRLDRLPEVMLRVHDADSRDRSDARPAREPSAPMFLPARPIEFLPPEDLA